MDEITDADLKRLGKIEPRWQGSRRTGLALDYDQARDVLCIYEEPRRGAVSVNVNGEAWLRCDPVTGDVTGAEIEDFERAFLPQHTELRAGWDKTKRRSAEAASGSQAQFAYAGTLLETLMASHDKASRGGRSRIARPA